MTGADCGLILTPWSRGSGGGNKKAIGVFMGENAEGCGRGCLIFIAIIFIPAFTVGRFLEAGLSGAVQGFFEGIIMSIGFGVFTEWVMSLFD